MTTVQDRLSSLKSMDVDNAAVCFAPMVRCTHCAHAVHLSFLRSAMKQTMFALCAICGHPYEINGYPTTDWLYVPKADEVYDVLTLWKRLRADENESSDPTPYLTRVKLHCRDNLFCEGKGHLQG